DAILAGVGTLVDVAVPAASFKQILDNLGVLRAGGALEVVDLQAQHLPLALKFGGDSVGEFARRFAGALGRALHIYTMLVGTGGEYGMVALHGFEALIKVGHDGGVGVANVRRGIHVIDRSSEVVFHRDCWMYA